MVEGWSFEECKGRWIRLSKLFETDPAALTEVFGAAAMDAIQLLNIIEEQTRNIAGLRRVAKITSDMAMAVKTQAESAMAEIAQLTLPPLPGGGE